MSWTAPKTWSTDEIMTAAKFNIDIKDNQSYLKTEFDKLTTITSANYDSTSRTFGVAYQNTTDKVLMVSLSARYGSTSFLSDYCYLYGNSTATPSTTSTAKMLINKTYTRNFASLVPPSFYYQINADDPNFYTKIWTEWILF